MVRSERIVAKSLFNVGAIKFDTAVGWKLKIHKTFPDAPPSPFYVDLRILRSFPSLLNEVSDLMISLITAWIKEEYDLLSDVPTASTPIVTLVSQALNIPMISPRLDAKTHGLTREIDGVCKPGQRVIIIDDLRTTGGSKEEVLDLLIEQGLHPLAVVVLLDRGNSEGAPVRNLPLIAVYNWTTLLDFYHARGLVSDDEYLKSSRYPEELESYIKSQTK